MAGVTSTNCTVCETQSIVKTAMKWCFECDESFCNDCLRYHSNAKSTKSHAVIDVSDFKELPEFVLKIKQHCEDHGALFQNYCLNHERPCCRKCINSNHRNCTDLPPLDEVIKDARTSTTLQDIQERLQDLKKYVEVICLKKDSNVKEIKAQSKTIIGLITYTRLKLNQHLDKLEREILQKVSQLEKNVLQSIEKVSKDLKDREMRIGELYNAIITMKNHASELQVFLGTKEIELEISKQENDFEEFGKNHFNLRSIIFQENGQLSAFSSEVSSFGDLAIHEETEPSTVNYTIPKNQQAQSSIEVRSFENIQLNIVKQIDFRAKKVFGSIIMEDGTACFAHRDTQKLTFTNVEGLMVDTIKLPAKPYDITRLNDKRLAITTGYQQHEILIINLKNKSVEKSFQTMYNCHGISFFDGDLIHNASVDGLLSLNLENGIVTKLFIGSKEPDAYVAVHDGKIFCTHTGCPSVQCYNADKSLAWEFKDKSMKGPRGIAVDENRIVYVANQDGGNIIIIKQDGSDHKIIKIDSIPTPRTLSFNKARTRLLICSLNGQAGIFEITK